MANPKWKTPRSKTRSRRAANWSFSPVTIVECSRCRAPRRPHFVCEDCGVYKDRQVIVPRADSHAGHAHG